MSPSSQQVAYVLALLGLMSALVVGILADRAEDTDARLDSGSGSSRDW